MSMWTSLEESDHNCVTPLWRFTKSWLQKRV